MKAEGWPEQGLPSSLLQHLTALLLCRFTARRDDPISPLWRSPGLEMHRRQARNCDVIADLAHLIHLERRRPVGSRFAGYFHTAYSLEPRAHFYFGTVAIRYLGQEPRIRVVGLVRSSFGTHILQDRVETAVQSKESEGLLHEDGQALRV